MGRRFKRRATSEKDSSEADCEDDELTDVETKPTLSLKDAGVILIMSTVLSTGLVMGTIGVNGVMERIHRNDTTDVMLAIFFVICLFSLLSYMLVKVAAHYLVYLAVATFCGIIFPVSPRKQRMTIREIYDKARK